MASAHTRACGNSSSHYPNARKNTLPFPQRQESIPSSAIPAKAGVHPIIRHSREGRSPSHHPSFPRRRESTIPAHAGMHRPITPTPEKIPCHSRKGRNPPHHPPFPQRQESIPSSVIPAKAGIHNSRACGNSSSHYPNTRKDGVESRKYAILGLSSTCHSPNISQTNST